MIIALDLETTWLDRTQSEIIEVALVKIDEKTFKVIDSYQSLVKPSTPIPEIVSNITNIFDEDVKDAPNFSEIQKDIIDFIWDTPILGHNVKFDKDFLVYNWVLIEKNIALDTFLLGNFMLSWERSLSLEYLSTSLWIKLEGSHRAMNDTLATVELFIYIIDKIQKLPKAKKDIFTYIAGKSTDASLNFILDTYMDSSKPSAVKDRKTYIDILLKEIKQASNKQEIIHNPERKSESFSDTVKTIESLEARKNQSQMSDLVKKAFYESQKIVIEAPTGIGKTFAYLIPAIDFSLNLWEQVYVSTTTKALQDQIFYKDLQFLEDKLDYDFSYTKLKWKTNYFWVQAFFDFFFSHSELDRLLSTFFLKMSFWLFDTTDGELDDLNYYWEEYYFLSKINANNPYIFSSGNTFHSYEFLIKARYKAKHSNIVIVNNNILFEDVLSENNILWEVKNLVLDEAHNLEDVLTSSLKKNFWWDDLERIFITIEKTLDEQWAADVSIKQRREQLVFDIGAVLWLFQDYIFSKVEQSSRYKKVLLKKDFFETNKDIGSLLSSINESFAYLFEAFDDFSDDLYLLLGKEIQFLESIQNILTTVLHPDSSETYIPILSFYEKKWVIVEYTILNPGSFLEKNLWNTLSSLVLTSATLKTKWNFDYVTNMYSLNDFDFHELETDFDYSKQALLFVPNDIGNIKNNLHEVCEFLKDFILVVQWKTLVLFTSFFSIETFYKHVNILFKNNGIQLLAQWVWGWKHKQIETFKKNADHSVLVWTDTFWQWIDISWDDLKYLIIHKIPFSAPTDPVFQARSRLFSDSFRDYAIPKSILKLKQGFGRLIRTKTDTWIVIFLDNRIHSTGWWQDFLSAFPSDINMKISPKDKLTQLLSK